MIAGVIHQRELFASMLRREVRARYKGSVLGILWSLVTPLVMMGAYTLVFSLIFTAVPFDHYPAYLLTGLSLWVFFAGGLEAGTASIVASANLIKKVAFERSIVPLTSTASHLVTFGAMVAVLVPVNLILQPETRTTMILLPVLIVCLIVMTAGLALALSALNVYFRDVQHILGALLLPWFFLTPIFYSLDQLPENVTGNSLAIDVLRWGNPLTPLVESVQDVAFFGEWPSMGHLVYVGVATVASAAIGILVFRRLEPEMAVEALSVAVRPGEVRARGLSRRFRIFHERNATLKETLMRRRRSRHTDLWALRGVDLEVAPGDSVGIVGENGSGKSTLLKLLAGIIPPHEGTVQVGGAVASMLELGAGFHPDFTGRENVYMNAAIQGLSRREVDARIDAIIAFSELESFIDNPVRTYSSGMYTRLGFAVASHVDSDVLLLDEVLAVGDEAFQRKCLGRIFEYRRGGGTVLFVSHDAEAVERVCDRAVLLEHGEVKADGSPADVLATYRRGLVRAGEAARGTTHEDAADEWGTRRVAITRVHLVGAEGESDRFPSAGPLDIRIDFSAAAPVPAPVFGIEIRSVDGTLCYGTNTHRSTHPIESVEGDGTITFAIERLPLHEGRFLLTVAVQSEDESEIYHWIDRRTEFSVFARAMGVGIVAVDGSWSVSARRGAAGERVTLDG